MNIRHIEYPSVFVIGGITYMLMEVMWRGFSHWSMGICGGICFLGIYILENKGNRIPMYLKCISASLFITLNEFITGCIVNIALGWNVWDYSALPMNVLGQICLLYTLLWYLISIPAFKIASLLKQKVFSFKKVVR